MSTKYNIETDCYAFYRKSSNELVSRGLTKAQVGVMLYKIKDPDIKLINEDRISATWMDDETGMNYVTLKLK